MKNSALIVFIFLILIACKNETKSNTTKTNVVVGKTVKKTNILEHPLIFEDLGIKINDFTSEDLGDDNFLITITIQVDNNEVFQKNHFFFIHAFPYDSYDDLSFLNFDTRDGILNLNTITFQKKIKSQIYDFKEIRFGLVDRIKKERYFVRTLNDIYLKP